MSVDIAAAARAYGAFFEALRPDHLERLRELAAPKIRFVDPFNDLSGVEQVIRLLERMFEDAAEVSFRMLDQACTGDRCFLRWIFSCRPKRWPRQTWTIEGVSMVRFDQQGRVVEHIDYWDAATQVYGRMPLVGSVLRRIGRRLRLPSGPVVPEASTAVPEESASNR